MFDFAVKGTVVGFNPSKDGTKTFVKIQPASVSMGSTQLQRDERPGILDVLLLPSAGKSLGLNAPVVVRGKGYVLFRDKRDPATGAVRTYPNFRLEAESVDVAQAA